MGMDQQTVDSLQNGIGAMGNVMTMVNNATGLAEAEAKGALVEQDAKENAFDMQLKAKETASQFREQQEQGRARQHTGWGKSNLAMSGSKELVRQAAKTKDKQTEDDILFQGDLDAQNILNKGRHDGNMFRINSGASANRSTLSLGSKIYK